MDTAANDEYFPQDLYDRLLGAVWHVQVIYKDKIGGELKYSDGTAFAVGNRILTAHHAIRDKRIEKIQLRNLKDRRVCEMKKKIHGIQLWDVIQLFFKEGEEPEPLTCFQFAESGALDIGQTLWHIGNPLSITKAFHRGRVVVRCENIVSLPHLKTQNMENATNILKILPYQALGHCLTPQYCIAHEKSPFLPVVICDEFVVDGGSSGGPLFNRDGKVAGMMIGNCRNAPMAIHASVLKKFFRLKFE